jgi:hypothetical protein
MKLNLAALGLTLAINTSLLSSCALITQGSTEEISVNSEPPGATVTLSSGETRVTPFSIVVPRKQDLQLHFSKPGYQSTDLSDDSRIEPGYVAAGMIPFMIPWAIDASSGAGFAHQQTSVTGHLDPIEIEKKDAAPRGTSQPPDITPVPKPLPESGNAN